GGVCAGMWPRSLPGGIRNAYRADVKRISVAVIVLCCLLVAVWFSGGDGLSYFGGNGREQSKPAALEGVQEADKQVKFRSRERVDEPTHRPEQLVWFYLPEVEIDGL